MHENLSQFAHEMGVSFELEVVNFDSFDPRSFSVSGNEAIVVNLPIWSASTHLSAIPSILHFVKQLSPKIVVSLDRGCERTDLPFPHYLLQGLQYYEVLLDSIDGGNVVSEISNKIERFLFQPQIESLVLGKLQVPEPMPHWRNSSRLRSLKITGAVLFSRSDPIEEADSGFVENKNKRSRADLLTSDDEFSLSYSPIMFSRSSSVVTEINESRSEIRMTLIYDADAEADEEMLTLMNV
ncbi:hypothetical protein LXL04_039125 [Taraxacum kok-saghyz]